jgi:K+-sensing histidine kinase KdpD
MNWFESNTAEIIERRKVPVLAIPADYRGKIEPNTEFVFATDFNDINNWEIMNVFRLLAKKLEARINVFYVHESNLEKDRKENENSKVHDMKNYFEGLSVQLHHSSKTDVVEAVNKFATLHKASLIMMIAHDRSWLSDLFHKSVTKEMSLYTQVPFLSLPDKHVEMNKSAAVSYW